MRDILKSVGDFFIMFLLLLVIGGVIELSSIVLEINSTLTDILLSSVALLFFWVFSFRILKRHHLKISTFISSIAIILIISSIIPDQTPALLHTTKHIYTFGFPFPFVTTYSESSSGFFLQHLSVHHSYSVDILPLTANIILMYLLTTFIRNNFQKPQILPSYSHKHI